MVKIGQNTGKSPVDLKILSIISDSSERLSACVGEKDPNDLKIHKLYDIIKNFLWNAMEKEMVELIAEVKKQAWKS